ncbi:DUF6221 family protein [Streptomyces sp. NPDC057307]|uniref:DUF6221 family protein n=1 Tax=Streptomyces sp. NPDC057307 TaxID=3346096 RepID=UPI00362BCAAE
MRQVDVAIMMEFLRARLREDETAARALKPGKNQDVARLRDQVLADVEAKRRLMYWVEEAPWVAVDDNRGRTSLQDFGLDLIARQQVRFRSPVIDELVTAYVDHPDFHPEWLPIEDESGGDRLRTSTQSPAV